MTQNGNFWAIIPAGGVGSRLWPLSRERAPKFLLDLTGSGRTLLQGTWDRMLRLTDPDHIIVVTGVHHAAAVAQQLPDLPAANLISEPSPRDSSAAIGLATALIEQRDPEAIVGSFAADHVIHEVDAFCKAIDSAKRATADGTIVTVGVQPTHAATGFGYIRVTDPLHDDHDCTSHRVAEFVEKPDRKTAKEYFEAGDRLWNAGMFVAEATALLDQMAEEQPAMVRSLRRLAKNWDHSNHVKKMRQVWQRIPRIAIDYTVAEPAARAGKMVCVTAAFDWSDIGDFASIAELISQGHEDELAVLGKGAKVVSDASSGIVASETRRLITVVGMPDVIVVDTPDVLLVTNKEHAQEVKKLVEKVRARGDLSPL